MFYSQREKIQLLRKHLHSPNEPSRPKKLQDSLAFNHQVPKDCYYPIVHKQKIVLKIIVYMKKKKKKPRPIMCTH